VPNSTKIPKAKSEPEERFNIAWRSLGGPKPEREYRFCERKWRFDFAWPEVRIAVEIEGGINEGKRRGYHMRKEGFLKDAAKYNRASILGWRVFRLAPSQIQPAALEEIITEVRRSRAAGSPAAWWAEKTP
jgi:very-short-patch-repair endonuclease